MTGRSDTTGNGRKWWFIAPALAITGLVFGAGGATMALKTGICANKEKNADQDQFIAQNTADIRRIDKEQAASLAAIQEKLKTVEAMNSRLDDIQQDLRKLVSRRE